MHKRKILDAFCCSGGAARGYQRAGFHVTGVDIADQPNYVGDDFYQGDAVSFIREHGHKFYAVHQPPPCQFHSTLTKGTNAGALYADFLGPSREASISTGRPYVIENVQGASKMMRTDVMLCGTYFSELRVLRHRLFELGGGAAAPNPLHVSHKQLGVRVAGWRHGVKYAGDYFAVYGNGGGKGTVEEWQSAMGMDWTADRLELAEAIPPAYTEYIGSFL